MPKSTKKPTTRKSRSTPLSKESEKPAEPETKEQIVEDHHPLVGKPIPDFELPDQNGKSHSRSSLLGTCYVLYTYPKDNTPGCTVEATGFRDKYDALKEKVTVIGLSRDTQASHDKFVCKYELPFTLLSDTEGVLVKALGAHKAPKSVARMTFLVNANGTVIQVWPKVSVKQHAQEVLDAVNSLL